MASSEFSSPPNATGVAVPSKTTGAAVDTGTNDTDFLTPKALKDSHYGTLKVYRALLTQAGTAAPVATVLENSLGGTVVYTYNGAGDYTGTLTGAFTANKTFFMLTLGTADDGSMGSVIWTSANAFQIKTFNLDTSANELTGASLQILVYP